MHRQIKARETDELAAIAEGVLVWLPLNFPGMELLHPQRIQLPDDGAAPPFTGPAVGACAGLTLRERRIQLIYTVGHDAEGKRVSQVHDVPTGLGLQVVRWHPSHETRSDIEARMRLTALALVETLLTGR